MSFAARAMMAVALLAGVYVLAAGVVFALVVAVYEGFVHGFYGVLLGKGVLVVVFVALALGRAFWAALRHRANDPAGSLLSAEDHPRLWDEVRFCADEVGTKTPDEILLVPQVNASVWEDSRYLGLVGGRRVLTLGAPLLMGLTRQQFRAVVAHELGHYSHRHTALAPIAYRGQMTLGHVVTQLGGDTVTGRIFAAYGSLYLRVTRSVTRRQELEADEWSSRIAGPAASAGALREIPALDALWTYLLQEYAFRVEGVRPAALFDGFACLLASSQRQSELAEVRRNVPEDVPSPYDTHPSLASRIAKLESLPPGADVEDLTLAVDLLSDPELAFRQLETVMFTDATLEPRSWEWLAETAGLQRAREQASLLVRATREPGSGAADLGEAIRALGRGGGRALVRPYVAPDDPADQVVAVARTLVTAAMCAAFVAHCGARFALDWDAADVLVDPQGHPIDVAALVDGTVDRESADRLLRALAELGVPLSFAVDPTTLEAEVRSRVRDLDPVIQAIAVCVHWRRMRVLVVAENALILKRVGLVEGIVSALRHGGSDGYRNALHHVASIPPLRLVEDQRSEVFPWDLVESAVRSSTRLSLTLNGKVRRLKIVRHATAGDLVGSLREHLGDRLTA